MLFRSQSVFAKKGTNKFLQIVGSASIYATGFVFANFDLENGVVGTIGASATATITDFGNGWYRCTMTATATATASGNGFLLCLITSATSARVEINSLATSVYLWGAQVEAGAYPTSYIPTVASTVTRNADVISKTDISDLIGSTEGTIFCQLQALANYSNYSRISISDGTGNNKISIGYNSGNGIQAVVSVAGSLIVNFNAGGNPITNNNKIAFKYKLNSFTLFVNGVSLATLSIGAIFSASTLKNIYFTDGDGSSYPIYGKLSSLALWKTALSDPQCEALTTL